MQDFEIHSQSKIKTDYEFKITIEDYVKELLEIGNNELTANLWLLQSKHPELFTKPSEVYKMIIEVKNNPTMFFKNNRPDISLMAKRLESGYVGKVGVVNSGDNIGKVAHATYSKRKNEIKRLSKLDYEESPTVGSPYPTLLSEKSAKTALGDEKSLSSDINIISQKPKLKKLTKVDKSNSQDKGKNR